MSEELKNIVRQHRRSSGLSQSELAKVAGVGKTVIFDIEHGKESVQFDTLKKVLAALNIQFVFESPLIKRQGEYVPAADTAAMKKAEVYQQGILAGLLEEMDRSHYRFMYVVGYRGEPISLALPVREPPYEFDRFPAVFEGLLPEGVQLEALLRIYKVDKGDLFQQLLTVGADVVGSLTIHEAK